MNSAELSPAAEAIRRQVRVLVLLSAAGKAGLVPLPVMQLHVAAYLADALSPIWNLQPLNDTVWKRPGGPFYPDLQHEIDRLVGRGLIVVADYGHIHIQDEGYRIRSSYQLNLELAAPVLSYIDDFQEERLVSQFAGELMLALSGLTDEQIENAFRQDATYSYKWTGRDNVIDFSEKDRNYSAAAANYIGSLLPSGAEASQGEKLHLYVRHLRSRLSGGR